MNVKTPWRNRPGWFASVEERGGWRWWLVLVLLALSTPLWIAAYLVAGLAVAFAGPGVIAGGYFLGNWIGGGNATITALTTLVCIVCVGAVVAKLWP